MNRNENAAVAKRADWEAAGLPGRPIVRNVGGNDKDLSLERLLRDPAGKVILLGGAVARAKHAAEVLTEHLDRLIDIVWFFHPEQHFLDTFGFTLGSVLQRKLTLPERAAVAAIVSYCGRYRPGLRIDEPVKLPRVLQDESERSDGYIYDFCDEARAYMLAEVAEDVFGLETEVVDDSNGWTVVLQDDEEGEADAETVVMLQGVCRLLQRYAVTPESIDSLRDAPQAREAWRKRKANRWAEMARMLTEIRDSCARIEAAGGVLASV